ncbi:hypothetical protein AB0M44_24060 [Streptosporangium subroseum]|uniref:hypothetical protein n=1 Tax=Streptosporangium subroseum TaxID=106412 RepID=UPI0034361568
MTTPPVTAVRPTFTITACVLARCGDCQQLAEIDDGTVHFPDIHRARTELQRDYGWTRADNTDPAPVDGAGHDTPADAERWRCDTCTARRECATTGHLPHLYEAWIDPRTGTTYDTWKCCDRCGIALTRPHRTEPPADYPTGAPRHLGLHWDDALPEGTELATAAHTLLDQVNALTWLLRWDHYQSAHPGAPIPTGGYLLDISAGITAADQLITLAETLRYRLATTTPPASTTHITITPANH